MLSRSTSMHSVDFTSRIKRGLFGGYKLKEKHFNEIVQNIDEDRQAKQKLAEENAQLQIALKQAELEIQHHKSQNDELASKLNESNVLLQQERDLNANQKADHGVLLQKFNDLEIKAAQDRDAALEKERKMDTDLQQLKIEQDQLIAKHQFELELQKHECERIIESLRADKADLEHQMDDAFVNMTIIHNAQTKTEKRRKQLERDLANCQRDLEKETNEKLELERQLEKLKEDKEAAIRDLLSQLEAANENGAQIVEQMKQCQQRNKDLQTQLEDALLLVQREECTECLGHGDAQSKLEHTD